MAKKSKDSSRKSKEKVKHPPSEASGGVPDPSKEYLAHVAGAVPVMTPRCRPLLVIFDLNGTLLYRKNNGKRYTERIHAKTFIEYCKERFTVMVWSSATRPNVESMCDELFPDLPEHLRWARDNLGLSLDDQKRNVQVYKRLSHVWQDSSIQKLHPFRRDGGQWDQTNTVLIDDSREKARSEPFNCITLPVFDSSSTEEEAAILPHVHEYLNVLACQEDVSCYIQHNPFKVEDNPPKVPHTALLPYKQYLETSEHERRIAIEQVWDMAYSIV
ncbi:HAD-like protein [Thozetella sp. PMI_491]|nr:HAD-like protein [Thozetella sp. PMI_491]